MPISRAVLSPLAFLSIVLVTAAMFVLVLPTPLPSGCLVMTEEPIYPGFLDRLFRENVLLPSNRLLICGGDYGISYCVVPEPPSEAEAFLLVSRLEALDESARVYRSGAVATVEEALRIAQALHEALEPTGPTPEMRPASDRSHEHEVPEHEVPGTSREACVVPMQ